ncbi:MAG: transposase [Polyangiaceae bacterium]
MGIVSWFTMGMDLTAEQWTILEPLIPPLPVRDDGKGRPWKPTRDVLNGILWVMRTGAPWKDMPARYPPYATCHRRLTAWVRDGTLRKVVEALARDLRERGGLDPEEAFVDGTFAGAKKGGSTSAKRSAARGPRSWQWSTALVFLSPSISKLLPPTSRRSWKTFFVRASSDALSTALASSSGTRHRRRDRMATAAWAPPSRA